MWWEIRKLMLHKDVELKGQPFFLEDGAIPLDIYETPAFVDHPLTLMYMKPCDSSTSSRKKEES